MRNFLVATFAAVAAVVSAPSLADATTSFTTIDNPGDPTFNQLLSINAGGVIAGYFGSGAAGHPNQAYYISPPYTSYRPANVTGAVQTQVTGLNGTTTVGFWSGTNFGAPQDANYGFMRMLAGTTGKTETILVNDLTSSAPAAAQLLGVNANHLAAGFYNDMNGASHGFVYNGETAAYTLITITGATSVAATSINDDNLVAGFFVDAKGQTRAFLTPLAGGTPITFNVPGSPVTQFLGVNNSGIAMGFFQDANNIDHGVIYNPKNAQWQQVDDPNGVGGTVLNGLNNNHQAVGFYTDAAGNVHGMLVTGAF